MLFFSFLLEFLFFLSSKGLLFIVLDLLFKEF